MTRLAVAIAFLALNFYTYNYLARKAVVPDRITFEAFPYDLGKWHCREKEKLHPEVLANLGATDYLICDFHNPDFRPVSLYVGYHATQIREEGGGSGENAIHPPAHCLPGSGWDIIDARSVPLPLPGLPQDDAKVKRLVIARGEARQLVYYWYQTQGQVIAEDWQKILLVGYDRAMRGRTDGALVRFTVPLSRDDDEQSAEVAFQDLAARVLPLLHPYIPE
jgi:EpsI family protein